MLAVMHRISMLGLAPEGSAQIELCVTLVGEAEPTVKLNGAIAGEGEGLARRCERVVHMEDGMIQADSKTVIPH